MAQMYFPDWLETFFEQYGPTIVDILLALPFVPYFRSLLIRFRNRHRLDPSQSPILQLPDELLLKICNDVYLSSTPIWVNHSTRLHRVKDGPLALKCFSRTNKRIRNIAAPQILRHVKIRSHYRQGWVSAYWSLKTCERSSDAKALSTALTLNVGTEYNMIKRPPKHFQGRLANLLPQFGQLTRLQFVVPNHSCAAFKKAFEKNKLELPGIRVLILSSHLDWLVSMCPDVEVLSTSDYHWVTSMNDAWPIEQPYEFIRAASRARKLQHFEMHESWSVDHLQAVLRSIPNIQSLAMPGPRYTDGIQRLLPILACFHNLQKLALGGAAELDVGFHPPRCGNVYFGREGRLYQRQVAEEGLRAVLSVGQMVFGRLKGLEELWIGDQCKLTSLPSADGSRDITWAYENRLLPIYMD